MKKYDFKKSEQKWQKKWRAEGIYEPRLTGKGSRKKFYNLMMFPYPSAEGLHAGNMYAFTGSDVYGRFTRMRGFDVFEPIGLDGFGIHSENYALKIGTHPMRQARVSEKRFYKQLEMIGNGFAWREHLETYAPEYYKWTQWIFIQMWKAGLAYRKKQAVNWCPKDKTVLADEQVEGGKCERCGSVVEKRELEQWFFRITEYSERLLENLETIDWSEKVKIAQRNWIGKKEGAEIEFPISNLQSPIRVFTTRPDTLFGATYLVLAPEHPLVNELRSSIINFEEVKNYVSAVGKKSETERVEEGKEKTGVELKGVKAINPATNEEISIWIADYVLSGYGTGAIMAVPAHDERDYEFAKKFKLPVRKVILPEAVQPGYPHTRAVSGAPFGNAVTDVLRVEHECYTGEGEVINSGKFEGMSTREARQAVAKEFGAWKVQYRLRDWLISRQRYWGPPIPMIYCPACAEAGRGEHGDMPGWYAEKEKNLPVRLPFVKNFQPKGTGESPLATVKSFYETRCPNCKAKARRETDVSDTFLDSAWYYLRYPSVKETKRPWNPAVTKKWFPVDMYIGGAEHSVLHLLYVRFLAMVLRDLKHTGFEEPFPRFRAHGLIIKDGAKMSKSKGNIVSPDEYISRFGADVLRMYLMFLAPFEAGGDFRDSGILGVDRFLGGLWRYFSDLAEKKPKGRTPPALMKVLHKTIRKVTEDIEGLKYNTAISQLMILLNTLHERASSGEYLGPKDAEAALKLVAPLAPFITEDIWRTLLKHPKTIHLEGWPKWDAALVMDETFTLVVQVNGKVRGSVQAPTGVSEAAALELALREPRVAAALHGQTRRKLIFVPDRLLNIVV